MMSHTNTLNRLGGSLIFGLLLLAFPLSSQTLMPTVLASSGGETQNGGFSLSWTMGESAIATSSAGGYVLTQGFHQPKLVNIVGSIDLVVDLELEVYPNPLIEGVHTRTEEEGLTYRIADLKGEVLQRSRPIEVGEDYIDLSQAPSGVLLLVIHRGSMPVKTIKLQKH